MQLATTSGDQPWICSVWFVTDENLNLYWASWPIRRHSQEISANPKVCAAVVVQEPNSKKKQATIGVQIQGQAVLVDKSAEIKPIAKEYAKKFGFSQIWVNKFEGQETNHKLYKLIPELFVLFDEQNFPSNTRLEWRPRK